MLYFVLYWKLLYGVGYIVVVVDTSFRISECHVYFQARMLHYDACMMQATREQSTSGYDLKTKIYGVLQRVHMKHETAMGVGSESMVFEALKRVATLDKQ